MTETSEPPLTGKENPDRAAALAFAASFRRFLEWVHTPDAGVGHGNPVAALVAGILGDDGRAESVVTRELPPFEHVNLQTALDAWSADAGRTTTVRGLAVPPHYGGLSLQQLVSGHGLPPVELSAPSLVDLPNGPRSTLACARLALYEVVDDLGHYLLLVQSPSEHEQWLRLEVAGLPVARAQDVLAGLDRLRSELNVYRGHLLDVTMNNMGGVVLTFADPPVLDRADVVLPDAVLDRIERHALGVAAHREALLRAGQHLKRGLLLYGPPGTGKTHTVRYLVGRMAGSTRLVLTGRALSAVGSVADLARELAPAVVVLEDVDLVAEDRSFGPASSPVLFDLLDAMDGAAADADLLFLLTTNRADLLEPALAARPGRVDVAVEVGLPDAPSRARLLELYSRRTPLRLTDDETREVVDRSEGVTASFLKELVRRAVLESLRDDGSLQQVTIDHVRRGLDDLLDTAQGVTRSLLGMGAEPAVGPGIEAVPGMAPPGGGSGWVAFSPRHGGRRHR